QGGVSRTDLKPLTSDPGPIWRFHLAFDRQFERLRSTYQRLLGWALNHRAVTVAAMLGFALASLALFPRTGRDFFPSVDAGQLRLHVRAPAGTRVEETERIFGQVEDAIREIVPDQERAMILDNMGLTQSFTIMAYVDNGTVSNADGEILVALTPEHRPTADYVAQLRRELPRRFPQCTFFFEPADITSQILNLDRKSTRQNSSHVAISYAVFCLKKKKKKNHIQNLTILTQYT